MSMLRLPVNSLKCSRADVDRPMSMERARAAPPDAASSPLVVTGRPDRWAGVTGGHMSLHTQPEQHFHTTCSQG